MLSGFGEGSQKSGLVLDWLYPLGGVGDRQATGFGRLVHTGKYSKGGLGGLDFILNVIKPSDPLFHR